MSTATTAPIGERIRLARESRGISQSSLAELIGKTRGGMSQIESGECYPSLPTLESICKILELSLDLVPLPKKTVRKK